MGRNWRKKVFRFCLPVGKGHCEVPPHNLLVYKQVSWPLQVRLTLSWFWFVPKTALPDDDCLLSRKNGEGETAMPFSAVSVYTAAPPQLCVWQAAWICNLVAIHTVPVSPIESASLWVPHPALGKDEGQRNAWVGVWLLPAGQGMLKTSHFGVVQVKAIKSQ